jgi:hypothetical protein
MVQPLAQQVVQLRARCEKELARGPIVPDHSSDTVAAGGWNKLGKDLELLQLKMIEALADHLGLSPSQLRRDMQLPDKPTIGQLSSRLRAFQDGRTWRSPPRGLQLLLEDLCAGSRSKLGALTNTRNAVAHANSSIPTVSQIRTQLNAAIALLRAVEKEL